MILHFTIGDTGRVVRIKAKGFDSTVDACIEKRAKAWRFGVLKDPSGKPAKADFEISLMLLVDDDQGYVIGGAFTIADSTPYHDPSFKPGIVRKIKTAYMNGLKRCHKDILKRDPSAGGRVALHLTIGKTGRVVRVKAKGFDSTVDECIEKRAKSWRFSVLKNSSGSPTEAKFQIALVLQNDDIDQADNVAGGVLNNDTSLRSDAVMRKIRTAYMMGLKRCHKDILKRDPSAGGRVTLHFTIGDTGRVGRVKAEGFDPAVDTCIEKRAKSWRFGIPKDSSGAPTEANFKTSLILRAE